MSERTINNVSVTTRLFEINQVVYIESKIEIEYLVVSSECYKEDPTQHSTPNAKAAHGTDTPPRQSSDEMRGSSQEARATAEWVSYWHSPE